MVRKRKERTPQQSVSRVEEIPEDEQWRIIEQSGVLKNIPREEIDTQERPRVEVASDVDDALCSPLCEEIFNAILFIIPFSSLYVMMDILAHRQYAQPNPPVRILGNLITNLPALSLFIFFTMRYKTDRRMQLALSIISVAAGARVIYVVNWANWRIVMRQCPPLATIWIYTIVQLPLLPAVLALAVVAGFVQWKGLKLII